MAKYQQLSRSRKQIKKFLASGYFKLFITFLSFFYTLIVFISLTFEDLLDPKDANKAQLNFNYIEIIILFIFLIEIIAGIYSLKFKGYFKDGWLIIDALVILFSVGFVIYDIIQYTQTNNFASPITKIIRAIFRFLRLFLLMRKVAFSDINYVRVKTSKESRPPPLQQPTPKASPIFQLIQNGRQQMTTLSSTQIGVQSEFQAIKYMKSISMKQIKKQLRFFFYSKAAHWIGFHQVKLQPSKSVLPPKHQGKRFTLRRSIFPVNFTIHAITSKSISLNVRQKLAEAEDINFNIFQFSQLVPDEELSQMMIYVFETSELLTELNINQICFTTFVTAVEQGYKLNPYHNRLHACDVVQTVQFLLKSCKFEELASLTGGEIASMYIAAAIHDYGHPGVNNAFLVRRRNYLALLYNDKGVLENYHVSASFLIMRNSNADIFSSFTRNQYSKIRSSIISMVLATDMSGHFGEIARIKSSISSPDFDIANKHKQMLMDSLVHAADVSNPLKQFDTCKEWAERILSEYWSQGDQEREFGDSITYLCDKYTTNTAKSQVGFIELIVRPLYDVLSMAIPGLKQYADNLVANQTKWQTMVIEYDDKLSNCFQAIFDQENQMKSQSEPGQMNPSSSKMID